MAYTQADLDAIDAEISSIRAVQAQTNGDRSTTFRPLEEMYTERARVAGILAAAAGTTRTRYVTTNKGV